MKLLNKFFVSILCIISISGCTVDNSVYKKSPKLLRELDKINQDNAARKSAINQNYQKNLKKIKEGTYVPKKRVNKKRVKHIEKVVASHRRNRSSLKDPELRRAANHRAQMKDTKKLMNELNSKLQSDLMKIKRVGNRLYLRMNTSRIFKKDSIRIGKLARKEFNRISIVLRRTADIEIKILSMVKHDYYGEYNGTELATQRAVSISNLLERKRVNPDIISNELIEPDYQYNYKNRFNNRHNRYANRDEIVIYINKTR